MQPAPFHRVKVMFRRGDKPVRFRIKVHCYLLHTSLDGRVLFGSCIIYHPNDHNLIEEPTGGSLGGLLLSCSPRPERSNLFPFVERYGSLFSFTFRVVVNMTAQNNCYLVVHE